MRKTSQALTEQRTGCIIGHHYYTDPSPLQIYDMLTPYHPHVQIYDICRSAELRVHRDTMHAGEKKYKCKDCGKLFSQKGSLNRHMAQVLLLW